MRSLLITDLHLGVKNGSNIWLKSQRKFLYEQFMPQVKSGKFDKVICLGDLFDVRNGVQTHVATFARQFIKDICREIPMIIIAGNHDFYSPDTDVYCSLETTLAGINNLTLVVRETIEDGDEVYIPWFVQEENGIVELAKKYKGKVIFTHADLVLFGRKKLATPVFSGHIHFPTIDANKNVYSLGSCFPLTFADCDERFAYALELDGGEIKSLNQLPNTTSIQFHRYRDWPEDIDELPSWDYIELYLKSKQIKSEDQLQQWQQRFQNLTIYKVADDVDMSDSIDMNKDMAQIVQELIPEEFQDILEEVRS